MTLVSSFRRLRLALAATSLVVLLGSAVAQVTVTAPAGSEAALSFSGAAVLSPVLRLSASSTALLFDLTPKDWGKSDMVCVEGSDREDASANVASFGDPRVRPAGTSLRVTDYPHFEVTGGHELSGPLTPPGALGQVVCYQTFSLRLFSNGGGWSLLAKHDEIPGVPPIDTIYLEAHCRGGAADAAFTSGMLRLEQGAAATLLRAADWTGCDEALVAVAVKPDLLVAGEAGALLTYTLFAAEAND